MTDKTKRRLAAILHADVFRYSALMNAAEDDTHADLRSSLASAAEIVANHGGQITGTAGDSFLANFSSVQSAISAAMSFQKSMAERNAETPADRRLQFRIGINLGEVIDDGTDIFGNGVNVAARIQALAEPGGIAVSSAVHDIVRKKIGGTFRDLGDHSVKNISEPIRVFALSTDQATQQLTPKRRRRLLVPLLAAALLGTAGAAVWFQDRLAGFWIYDQIAGIGGEARAEARPVVAVMPFAVPQGGENQEFLGAGVTEDVIAHLGRFSSLLVLSWSAVAPYHGNSVPLTRIVSELNARYVVSGSIRNVGERVQISVQLTDARRGVLLWSSKYDEPAEELFEVQHRISRAVVQALAVKLTAIERQRSLDKPTTSLSAYERVLRGRHQLRDPEFDANLGARALFEAALESDPNYADAYVGLGLTHNADVYWGWIENPDEALAMSEAYARRALELNSDHAAARALLAETLWLQGSIAQAELEMNRALELNPNDANIHALYGTLLLFGGRDDRATEALELALRLDPNARAFVVTNLATAYYLKEDYERVLTFFASQGRDFPEDPAPHAIRAAALAQLGRIEEARAEAETVRQIYPFFDADNFSTNFNTKAASHHLNEGLTKAGLN